MKANFTIKNSGCKRYAAAQTIKKVPFLMGRADPLKSCGISGRGSERGSVNSCYAL